VIKPEQWDADLTDFSLVMAFSPLTGRTCALLHILLKSDLEQTLNRLKALKDIAWHPLLLPLILLEHRTERMASTLSKIRTEIYSVEKTAGTHKNYQRRRHHDEAGYYAIGEKVWEREDFESTPNILTAIASDCAFLAANCEINKNMLSWIDESNSQWSKEFGDIISCSVVGGKISTMRTWLQNNHTRSSYLGQRAQVQIQAVS